jgi:Fe-S-cluster containining protein
MATPLPSIPSSRPITLVEAIRQGGPAAKWFQAAAAEQRRAIAGALRGRRTEELIAALRDDAAERVQTGVACSPLAVLHQCAAGCSACCRTAAVDVTPLEALAVADYLRANLAEKELAETRQRLESNAQARSRMAPEQLRRVRLTCAFLSDDGKCGVYPARPLACAGAFSMSRQACHAAAENPTSAAAQQVPFDPHTKSWTMGVSGGLQRALVEAGLDGNLYELSSIVLRALDVPDAALRWLRREDVFQGCTCTDAHSPPRVRRPHRQRAVART